MLTSSCARSRAGCRAPLPLACSVAQLGPVGARSRPVPGESSPGTRIASDVVGSESSAASSTVLPLLRTITSMA